VKVVTGKVRFSYPNVFEPKSVNGSAPRYSVSLIIPKSDKKTLGKIKTAIDAVLVCSHVPFHLYVTCVPYIPCVYS